MDYRNGPHNQRNWHHHRRRRRHPPPPPPPPPPHHHHHHHHHHHQLTWRDTVAPAETQRVWWCLTIEIHFLPENLVDIHRTEKRHRLDADNGYTESDRYSKPNQTKPHQITYFREIFQHFPHFQQRFATSLLKQIYQYGNENPFSIAPWVIEDEMQCQNDFTLC